MILLAEYTHTSVCTYMQSVAHVHHECVYIVICTALAKLRNQQISI